MTITPSQIVQHRNIRKQSGMVGCITGRPAPELDFYGYRDVQIWNLDAQGRLNGDPNFNRMDPHCFCFDCRGSFDSDGLVDAELVNSGHERACFVYSSLLRTSSATSEPINTPKEPSSEPTAEVSSDTSYGFSNEATYPSVTRTMSSHGFISESVNAQTLFPQRTNGNGV